MGYERLNLKTGQVITEEVFAHLEDGIEGAANAVLMTPILYADLVALRNAGQLKAGMFYRITDYVTTTVQENTQSAGHAFDVIVMATDSQTLSEEARAIVHDGDTYFTEAGANLAAWKVWYALDNDSARFAWADAENGKGVIYRLIDEWNNDCPYDFKNIIYAIPLTASGEIKKYGSWYGGLIVRLPENDTTIAGVPYYAWKGEITQGPSGEAVAYSRMEDLGDLALYDISEDSVTESAVMRVTTVTPAINQTTFKSYNARLNIIKPYIHPYGMAQELNFIIFGINCHSNTFGFNCRENTFGNDCYSNSFGNDCYSNSFGDNCNSNSFGNDCNSNSFGNNCDNNSFGNNCDSNSFGNDCNSNSFGNDCNSNSFGNDCDSNSFGNDCYTNSFGDNCNSNSFGNNCDSNSFGNNCDNNSFGEGSEYNSFCGATSENKGNYYKNNHLGDGVRDCVFTNSATASDSQCVQNYDVAKGVKELTIAVTRNLAYETKVALTTSGELKMFNLADLAN